MPFAIADLIARRETLPPCRRFGVGCRSISALDEELSEMLRGAGSALAGHDGAGGAFEATPLEGTEWVRSGCK